MHTEGEGGRWVATVSGDDEPSTFVRDLGVPLHLRMFGEYGVQLPVWDLDGELDADELRTRGVSPGLVTELAAWNGEWETVCSRSYAGAVQLPLPEGWEEDHAERGRGLAERLRAELGPEHTLTYRA